MGWVLWLFEANQTPACKYHLLRIQLRLVCVAKMDLEEKLSTICRTIIEGGSTTISSWMSLVGWVLWQFEANQNPECKYHFLRIKQGLDWVAKMDLWKKLSTICWTIIERGSTTISSWKSLVDWVLWQFEASQTSTCKYRFLRIRPRLVWVAKMDFQKKLSTICWTIIERGATTIYSESHWWVESYGSSKRIKIQHVNTISWG